MPILRSGSFVLYGITLENPSTLTDGALIDPGHAGNYYLTNLGSVPTILPCDPQWSPPTLLDTTTEGTGFPAGAPPPGFTPNFVVGVTMGPGIFSVSSGKELAPPPDGFNVGNYWEMGGSLHVAFPTLSFVQHSGAYAGLLTDFLTVHIQDYHAPPHEINVWPTSGGISTPTTGPRFEGSYDIVAWWWIISVLPKVATVTNEPSLSGLQTVEGIIEGYAGGGSGSVTGSVTLVPGDRIIVAAQDDPSENGTYIASAGAWTRTSTDVESRVSASGVDACGRPHVSRLVLSETEPSGSPDGTFEKLDPDDIDAAPTPVIEEVIPNHGPTAGGIEITIKGSGFGEGCEVEIDGIPCTGVNYISQYEVRATTPAHAAGLENVVLTNLDGVSS